MKFAFFLLAFTLCASASARLAKKLGRNRRLDQSDDAIAGNTDDMTKTITGDSIIYADASGSIIVKEDSITFQDETYGTLTLVGVVTYDDTLEAFTLTNDEGSFSFNQYGFVGIGDVFATAGSFTDDTTVSTTDDSINFSNEDGSLTITDTSVTFIDKNGQETTLEGEVTYDDEYQVFTLTNEDGTFFFNEDGYLAQNDDMVIVGDEEGGITVTDTSVTFFDSETGENITIEGEVTYDDESGAVTVTNEEGTFSFNEDGFIAYNDDMLTIGDEEGGITVTDNSVTFFDPETGENFTVEGEVTYDDESGSVTVTNEEGTFSFNEDGFIAGGADDDGVIIGDAEGSITITDSDGGCLSIPDIVCMNPAFSIFCDILSADEEELATFSSKEYTLFLPTDSAFGAIEGPLDSLDTIVVEGVVLFHFTYGSVYAEDMYCSGLVEMLDGTYSRHSCQKSDDLEDIYIQKGGGNRRNNLLPQIIMADIEACNGIVHVIDHVMLPNYIPTFD